MKRKLLSLILMTVLAPLVFAVNDANNPYRCEQHMTEGYKRGYWTSIDPNGWHYPGNELKRTWTKMPLPLVITESDCDEPNSMDMCKKYYFAEIFVPATEPNKPWVFEFYDEDKRIDGPNNVTYTVETWFVSPPPDTIPPIPACGRIMEGGE